ncbi:MAG: Molybdopterin adenylyltransferase [Methanoregulaceae archaeon PtaB.Bin056]|nr:MAG: Molybdopterin adenylyltransferase [Methanoregulaceae archaeon PtaB.Bin056]
MHPHHERPVTISVAVVTVSSTRNRDNDTSGKEAIQLLEKAGFCVAHYTIVPDDIEAIRRELLTSLRSCNCVIFNGGTGLTPDDFTIEAVSPLLEKKMDGFGELFRAKSVQEVGTSAILSRALAGVCHGKAVFCIPGSTAAVTLATRDLIIPELRHIISHAMKRH